MNYKWKKYFLNDGFKFNTMYARSIKFQKLLFTSKTSLKVPGDAINDESNHLKAYWLKSKN